MLDNGGGGAQSTGGTLDFIVTFTEEQIESFGQWRGEEQRRSEVKGDRISKRGYDKQKRIG